MIPSIVYHQQTCINSMAWARAMLAQAPHGALFLADIHEQPSGRDGRRWVQMPGQLLLTLVLKPVVDGDIEQVLAVLSMACAVATLEPLLLYGVGLKWPNDFMLHNKKMGGMLLEAVFEGSVLRGVIVGIGLNINTVITADHELAATATSVYAATGIVVDPAHLQNKVLVSLQYWYERWQAAAYDAIFHAWRDHQVLRGRVITAHMYDGSVVTGVLQKVDNAGCAQLTTSAGSTLTIPFCVVRYIDI